MSAGAKRRRQHLSFGRAAGSQCLGKLRYRNQAAAETAIKELPGYARAYRCPLCKYLHLTSKPSLKKETTP